MTPDLNRPLHLIFSLRDEKSCFNCWSPGLDIRFYRRNKAAAFSYITHHCHIVSESSVIKTIFTR